MPAGDVLGPGQRGFECPVPANFRVPLGGPEMAGLRPSYPAAATGTTRLHLCLLCNLQRIIDFDAEVSDCAFEFAVTKQ